MPAFVNTLLALAGGELADGLAAPEADVNLSLGPDGLAVCVVDHGVNDERSVEHVA